jgi:hypothetical protein
LLGKSEHYVKVFDRQQLGCPLLRPLLSCCGLAFWAMPIAARVVSDLLMTALGALLHMSTDYGSAALDDVSKHTTLLASE